MRAHLLARVAAIAILAILVSLPSHSFTFQLGCDGSPSPGPHPIDRIATDDGASSHPLAGKFVFASPPRSGPRECAASTLQQFASLSRAGYIVLAGEVHDNPLHHRIRAEVFKALRSQPIDGLSRRAGLSMPPAVVFEHLNADQVATLDRLQLKDGTPLATSADEWFSALDWDKSGWPDKAIFKPLFEEVIAGRHPVYAGEPARGVVREISRQGFAAVAADEIKRLGLDSPLPETQQKALLDDLEASHCGLMPRTAFGKMAEAQRYRDAHLASVVDQTAQKHGAAILLAGNGHVRRDRGVPHYLRRNAVAIALIEVEDGKTSPDDYVERGPDGKPVYDAILFTARADRKDPCVEMREMMQKKK